MLDELRERIYEAAIVPEFWPDVLGGLAEVSGSAAGSLIVFNPPAPPRFRSTPLTRASLTAFVQGGAWRTNPREEVGKTTVWPGFYSVTDTMPESCRSNDPVAKSLEALGLWQQIGSFIPLPHGENAVITLERQKERGRYDPSEIAVLDELRPHLARAVLTTARIGLERARTTVATLECLGLSAAVLTGSGRVLAVNGLLAKDPVFSPGAYGRLILSEPAADRSFRDVLEAAGTPAGARSIPMPRLENCPAGVVHVMPLCGAAHDILGGATLIVHAPMVTDSNVPDPNLLPGLFDLTPRESQLAAALAAGQTLHGAAYDVGIRNSTARSYLESIFRKTNTNQQSQLVALLKGSLCLNTN